jgi:hypothetical protein
MGADEALVSGSSAVKLIKDITRGQGANLVLDMVGVKPTLEMANADLAGARARDDCWPRRRSASRQLPQPGERMFRRLALLGLDPGTHGGR